MILVNNIKEHLSHRIECGELSNNDCVNIIEHIGMYGVLFCIKMIKS